MGFRSTQLVYVAAKLGLADRLAAHPRTVGDVAEEVSAHPDTLRRLLRALATLGIFAETPDGSFRLDVGGELLRSNVPGSMRNVALLYGDDWLWRAYGNMLYSVRTAKPAFWAKIMTRPIEQNPLLSRNAPLTGDGREGLLTAFKHGRETLALRYSVRHF
jgi:hypothetical protein